MFKWVQMLLKNSKAVGALLLVLFSGLGVTGWTVFDQHHELTQLRPIEVKVVETPDVEQLKRDVSRLKRWHE